MSRFKVTIDTSFYEISYREITVDAKSAGAAKYKVATNVMGFNSKDFGYFLSWYKPQVEKVDDHAPLIDEVYIQNPDSGEFERVRLEFLDNMEVNND